ncbi:MAG: hypothetical protein Q8859_07555 [Bacteroidota bacterium]|nr:hypothetical protein [Bacteroidota bacterium]
MIRTILILIISFSFFCGEANAQKITMKEVSSISWPEKVWAIFHPFVVARAYKITKHVERYIQEMPLDSVIDGDNNGGNSDAFRHAFWMASLSRKISRHKALSLGRAHERGNKRMFYKRQLEDGALPDEPSSAMDLENNKIGVNIGYRLKKVSEQVLVDSIKQAIAQGALWRLKKDSAGIFYDLYGKAIDLKLYRAKWENPKCLIKTYPLKNLTTQRGIPAT